MDYQAFTSSEGIGDSSERVGYAEVYAHPGQRVHLYLEGLADVDDPASDATVTAQLIPEDALRLGMALLEAYRFARGID